MQVLGRTEKVTQLLVRPPLTHTRRKQKLEHRRIPVPAGGFDPSASAPAMGERCTIGTAPGGDRVFS